MATTNQEVVMEFRGEIIEIPKGTRITHQTAMGYDPEYNFVDDLSWLPEHQEHLRHDATYSGINVEAKYVDE